MFLGTSDHNLDSKGRVILPTDFREELGESFYITMGFNRCVQVLSIAEFDRLREQIRQLPADKALALQYLLISPAKSVSPNSQGRVSIPQKLREDAGLSGEVTVVGMDTRIEIWDKEAFTAFMEQQKQASVKEALELLRL
ncbi:MAG: division/cell wall cluster transcriptional repressor MraZ [Ruminococcus sp.]|uniref:division/cell wall cluster transcriptional repressor MraZ n=1 Tax=Ruminococcus sp. TaxID=41978 RepID=UPI002873C474|nr:division/cell wall cluster transcriptional repressor MraZ [Ruminococcus sp.]MBQ3285889.1 division/cell wall cluster transcriptional repressor MraZ [Ruminococcus sp.]